MGTFLGVPIIRIIVYWATRKIFEYQIVADVQAINKLNIYGDYYAGTFTVESKCLVNSSWSCNCF